MTSDEYIQQVITKYRRTEVNSLVSLFISLTLSPVIKKWAGDRLINDIEFSGSTAKGTATVFGSDVDIFVPLKYVEGSTLADYYNGLYEALAEYSPRRQNVSIRIEYRGYKLDIVPGRQLPGYTNYFTLYKSKTDSWTQTNIRQNIKLIKESVRVEEIIALKVWRHRQGIDISSTLLEFLALEFLSGHKKNDLSRNVFHVICEIADKLTSIKIVDPSNTNNVLTEELSDSEKLRISKVAKESSEKKFWSEIIW